LGQKLEDLQDLPSRHEERATTDAFFKIEIWRIEVAILKFPRGYCWGYTKWVYTSDVVLNRQAWVAHRWWLSLWPKRVAQLLEAHGGFPDKEELMADSSKTSLWRISMLYKA
jgi:hypothetical protein